MVDMKFYWQIYIFLAVFILLHQQMFAVIDSAYFKISGPGNYEFYYNKNDDISIDNNGSLSLSNWGFETKYKINCSIDIKQKIFHKFIFYYYRNINIYGGYPQGETRDSLYIENLPFEIDENGNLIVDISNEDIDSSYYPMYFIHDYYYLKDVKSKVDKQYYKLEDLKYQKLNLTFILYHDKTLDINETNVYQFEISPNPASEYIEINLGGINHFANHTVYDALSIEIFDIFGVLMQSTPFGTHTSTPPSNRFVAPQQQIDVSNLISGVYIVKIDGSNGACSIIEKFVKY